MKQFIVLAAVLPLMLLFFVQFSVDQINASRAGLLADMVYAAKEEAKQAGCFTEEIESGLRDRISETFGIEREDILIEATRSVQYRINDAGPTGEGLERGLIYYKVCVPIGELMAGGRLMGIGKEDNTYFYTIESCTASERLP